MKTIDKGCQFGHFMPKTTQETVQNMQKEPNKTFFFCKNILPWCSKKFVTTVGDQSILKEKTLLFRL
jgi:hypothetical protein